MDYYSRPLWLLRQARQLFYPRRCPFCGQVLGTLPVCPDCEPELEELRRTPSMRLTGTEHFLAELDGAAAPYRYSGLVRRAVLTAKYQNAPWAAVELGTRMARLLFGSSLLMQGAEPVPQLVEGYAHGYHLILPVPPSSRRRGYNVPERMAQPITHATGIPLRTDLLLRTHTGRRQEGLTLEERLENVAHVFSVSRPEEVENKRILLIDDVITTGATVSACTHALLMAGAESVYAMAFATVESETPRPAKAPIAEDSVSDEDDLL